MAESYNRYLSVDDARRRRLLHRNNFRENHNYHSKSYDERVKRSSVDYSSIPRWKTCDVDYYEEEEEDHLTDRYRNPSYPGPSRASESDRPLNKINK